MSKKGLFVYVSSMASASCTCSIRGIELCDYYLKTLTIETDCSEQVLQTQIRILTMKKPAQDLRCLPFHLHLLAALQIEGE